MRRLLSGAAVAVLVLVAASCSKPDIDPLQLERNRLTVDNRSGHDWTNVEVWINRQFRITVPTIRAGQRFQAPLDVFVTAYGRRFEFDRIQIRDVRLNAKRPDGTPFELRKQFEGDRLSDALKGIGGKR